MNTSFTFRDILRSMGHVTNASFKKDVQMIENCVDTFTGHGISKEYATKVKEEILPNITVDSLNAMIRNARSARGGFSHSCMNGRLVKIEKDEEKTTK